MCVPAAADDGYSRTGNDVFAASFGGWQRNPAQNSAEQQGR
jgi:hypothetical protein